MLHYDNMENLMLYKQTLALPRTIKNKNMAIFINAPDLNSTVTELNTIYKKFKNCMYIKSFFRDRIYRFKMFSKLAHKKIDNTQIYKDIKADKNNVITKTYKNIDMYDNNNVFIDLSEYNNLFFNTKPKTLKGDRVILEYINLLNSSISKYSYDKKIMILDLDQYNLSVTDNKIYSYMNTDNPFTILYSEMKRNIENFKKIPYDILLLYGNSKIRIIPSECDGKSADKLRSNIRRMKKGRTTQLDKDSDIDTITTVEEKKQELIDNTVSKIDNKINTVISPVKYNFTGEDIKLSKEIEEKTKNIVSEMDEVDELSDEEVDKKVEEELNKDDEFLSKLDLVTTNSYTSMFTANDLKRNKMLAEKQAKVQINKKGKTIEQILDTSKSKQLTPKEIKSKSINPDMKSMKLPAFTKNYNDKLLDADTIAILNFFKDKRVPVYVRDIKKEDTSDTFDKKYTYTVSLESGDRVRHTLKFDFPKFIDDSFLYLGGNKKSIQNQLFLKPVSKTSPDTVQMCSNYNKIFIRRAGTKISPKIERLKKSLNNFKTNTSARSKISFKVGNNANSNIDYLTSMEYDELGNYYNEIKLGNLKIYFNQSEIRKIISDNKLKYTENDNVIPIGINNKNVILLDSSKNNIVGTNLSLVDYIIEESEKIMPGFKNSFSELSVGKRFIYSEATIMKKKIPVLLLLSYLEGLTTVLHKANIKYRFSDKREKLTGMDKSDKGIIQFADGYLIYDRYPMNNSLLLNALSLVNTKDYKYEEFDKKEVYLDIFDTLYGNKIILNAFENFYDLFIDPITLEVLEDLKLPTDFVSLTCYASSLLEDNQYINEYDLSLYRLRNNEVINAYLYKLLANSYSVYRSSFGNKNPIKMSIPKDALIKEVLLSNTIEDYSTLNPYLEAEKLRATSYKGLSGLNVERAYTLEKRTYDKSMKGIIALSSTASGNVGVVKQLAYDANITSPRGYLQINKDNDNLNSANLFCPSELLTPGIVQHDDSPRVSMATSQSKHVVPCDGYDEFLVSNGSDETLSQIITNDFAFKAKKDGKVEKIDDVGKVMIIKYKDGTMDAIDLENKISKNGGGGIYINNTLETDYKEGESFKKDDVIAYNRKFFNSDDKGYCTFKSGALVKIAITSGYFTYEDSQMISKSLSDKLATDVVMNKQLSIGKNSNIEFIVNVGDHVNVGDPLIIFDESYEDESINKLLAGMNDNTKEKLMNISKVPIKSKYAGDIIDIKCYYDVDEDELSPSLRKLVNNITSHKKKKLNTIKNYLDINDTDIITDPVSKVESKYGKIKGVDVGDGVLLEFYINKKTPMGVGDKLVVLCALKNTVCKVMDEGKEPYSEFRPDEEISAFLSPQSELARMTKSIEFNMFANKALIELKRKVKEIYYK